MSNVSFHSQSGCAEHWSVETLTEEATDLTDRKSKKALLTLVHALMLTDINKHTEKYANVDM